MGFSWFATDSSGNNYATAEETGSTIAVFKSTDDGVHWFKLPMAYPSGGKPILVNQLGHIYNGSESRGVFRSTDGGQTCEQLYQGLDNYWITSLALMPDGRILAGSRGRLHISLRSTTDIDQPPRPVPGTLEVESIHPQPVHDRVTIGYAVPVSGAAELYIYDALGRLVRSDRQEHSGPGRYAFFSDLHRLPRGLYAYVLQQAGQVVRGKFIVSE